METRRSWVNTGKYGSSMYASIRKYKLTSPAEAIRRVKAGFVPLVIRQEGFVAYYGVDSGNGTWTTISIFESREGAEKTNPDAAKWVSENVGDMVEGTPEVTSGEMVIQVWPKQEVLERAA